MRRSSFAWVMAAVLVAGTLAPEVRAESLRAVQNDIAAVLAHPKLRDAQVGAMAVSLDRGDEIVGVGADVPMIPASNMKLVTVATALQLLGPGHDCSPVPGVRGAETLGALAPRILKPSDNALADALLAELPAEAGRPDLTPPQLCAEAWGERGLHLHGANWEDGSGLSRRDMMSAEVVVGLLRVMDRSRWRRTFINALPVAGTDGTLSDRMRSGQARGRVRAKTGTLTGVSALSGYAVTAGGERLAFALIMNGFDCDVRSVRRMQDTICEALAGLAREDVHTEQAGSEQAAGD